MEEEDEWECDDEEMEGSDEAIDQPMHDAQAADSPKAAGGLVSAKDTVVLSAARLQEQQGEQIRSVAELLSVNSATARLLLRHFRWDKDRLSELYFDNPDRIMESIGVAAGTAATLARSCSDGVTPCAICFNASPTEGFAALAQCGHRFCAPCFASYLAGCIEDRGMDVLQTTCPMPTCDRVCDHDVFESLLSTTPLHPPHTGANAKLLDRFRTCEARSFVEHNSQMMWCVNPDCHSAVSVGCRIKPDGAHIVACSCGTEFCFLCGGSNHKPASCVEVRDWAAKLGEGGSSAWIASKTKPCPSCHVSIEKSGGCNHMVCRSCQYQFCWICEQDWAKHGTSWFRCNYYKPGDEVSFSRDSARREIERFSHYYKRYHEHKASRELERKLLQDVRKRTAEPAVDHTFLQCQQEALAGLLRSRLALQYSYVHSFFCEDCPERTLFEFGQSELEHCTETLSGYLELGVSRQELVNQHGVVRQCVSRIMAGVIRS
eukprot:TRINITY_DN8793_c1_g1_i1.p1 TRINITY_DN8793_c1_g1~~TRINITY_DN8793_c1_g1_i1.p1  ORF type:complete len:514 (+),score=79.95 TRINITY_DN8793_c1_g1_i1:77-1543(+)